MTKHGFLRTLLVDLPLSFAQSAFEKAEPAKQIDFSNSTYTHIFEFGEGQKQQEDTLRHIQETCRHFDIEFAAKFVTENGKPALKFGFANQEDSAEFAQRIFGKTVTEQPNIAPSHKTPRRFDYDYE